MPADTYSYDPTDEKDENDYKLPPSQPLPNPVLKNFDTPAQASTNTVPETQPEPEQTPAVAPPPIAAQTSQPPAVQPQAAVSAQPTQEAEPEEQSAPTSSQTPTPDETSQYQPPRTLAETIKANNALIERAFARQANELKYHKAQGGQTEVLPTGAEVIKQDEQGNALFHPAVISHFSRGEDGHGYRVSRDAFGNPHWFDLSQGAEGQDYHVDPHTGNKYVDVSGADGGSKREVVGQDPLVPTINETVGRMRGQQSAMAQANLDIDRATHGVQGGTPMQAKSLSDLREQASGLRKDLKPLEQQLKDMASYVDDQTASPEDLTAKRQLQDQIRFKRDQLDPVQGEVDARDASIADARQRRDATGQQHLEDGTSLHILRSVRDLGGLPSVRADLTSLVQGGGMLDQNPQGDATQSRWKALAGRGLVSHEVGPDGASTILRVTPLGVSLLDAKTQRAITKSPDDYTLASNAAPLPDHASRAAQGVVKLSGQQPTAAAPDKSDAQMDLPYTMGDDGSVQFQPGRFADGLLAAHQAGIVDDAKLKDLLGKATAADKAYADQQALQKRVSADDWAKAKSFATGLGRGAIFAAAAIPGAEAGAATGAALGGFGGPAAPVTVPLGGFIGGAIGGLASGYLGSKIASAAGSELAKHSATIKSFADASEALPKYDAAGNLVSMVIPGAAGIAKLARVSTIRAAEMGGAAALKLSAKEAATQAAGGAAFEGAVRPTFDWAIQQGKQALGAGGDPNDPENKVQAPTIGSVLENALLGVALGNLGTRFRGYTTEEIGGLWQRTVQARAEGKTPEEVLTKSEQDALNSAFDKLAKIKASGQPLFADPANLKIRVQQALNPDGTTRAIASDVTVPGEPGNGGSRPSSGALPPSPGTRLPPPGSPQASPSIPPDPPSQPVASPAPSAPAAAASLSEANSASGQRAVPGAAGQASTQDDDPTTAQRITNLTRLRDGQAAMIQAGKFSESELPAAQGMLDHLNHRIEELSRLPSAVPSEPAAEERARGSGEPTPAKGPSDSGSTDAAGNLPSQRGDDLSPSAKSTASSQDNPLSTTERMPTATPEQMAARVNAGHVSDHESAPASAAHEVLRRVRQFSGQDVTPELASSVREQVTSILDDSSTNRSEKQGALKTLVRSHLPKREAATDTKPAPAPAPVPQREPATPEGQKAKAAIARLTAKQAESNGFLSGRERDTLANAHAVVDADLNRQVLGPNAQPTTEAGKQAQQAIRAFSTARDVGAPLSPSEHAAWANHQRVLQNDYTQQRRAIEAKQAATPPSAGNSVNGPATSPVLPAPGPKPTPFAQAGPMVRQAAREKIMALRQAGKEVPEELSALAAGMQDKLSATGRANFLRMAQAADAEHGLDLAGHGVTLPRQWAGPVTARDAANTATKLVGRHRAMLDGLGVREVKYDGTSEGNGSGIEFNTDTGTLRIDPAKLAKSMETVGQNQSDLELESTPDDWFSQVLVHEGIHAADAAVAKAKGQTIQERYEALPKEAMPEGWQKAGRDVYGAKNWDALPEWKRKSEFVRQVVEGKYTGRLTEQLYKFIQEAIAYLKQVAGFEKADPRFRAHVEEVEARIKAARESGAGAQAEQPITELDRDTLPQSDRAQAAATALERLRAKQQTGEALTPSERETARYAKEAIAEERAKDARSADEANRPPSREELAQAEAEHRAELLRQAQDGEEGAGGVELLDAIRETGGIPTNDPVFGGELNNIREASQPGAVAGYKGTWNLFRKGAPSLDVLTRTLREQGFDVETPTDTLDLIHQRLHGQRLIHAYPARAEAQSGMHGRGALAAARPESIEGEDAPFNLIHEHASADERHAAAREAGDGGSTLAAAEPEPLQAERHLSTFLRNARISEAESGRVAKRWQALAESDAAFRHGKQIESGDPTAIARHYSRAGQDLSAHRVPAGEISQARRNDGAIAAVEFTNRREDLPGVGKTIVYLRDDGTGFIDSSEADSAGQKAAGGDQAYQAALSLLHNQGLKRVADPQGVSDIASVRVTSQMLSSALRHETTAHLEPGQGQDLVTPWKEGDNEHNIASLALTELRNVARVFPEILSFKVDEKTGKISGYVDGKKETFYRDRAEAEQKQALPLESLVDRIRSRPDANGVGKATLLRSLVTRAAFPDLDARGLYLDRLGDEQAVSQKVAARVPVRSLSENSLYAAEPEPVEELAPPARRGSTQLTLSPEQAKPFQNFARQLIPAHAIHSEKDAAGKEQYGRELEPHVTSLYGLTGKGDSPEAVAGAVKNHGSVSVRLGKLSAFSHPDKPYDVLKVNVHSPGLHALNERLSALEHESDFPNFSPHLTLAYVKKGEAAKLIARHGGAFEDRSLTFDQLTHSPADRAQGKTALPLGTRDESARARIQATGTRLFMQAQYDELTAKQAEGKTLTTQETRELARAKAWMNQQADAHKASSDGDAHLAAAKPERIDPNERVEVPRQAGDSDQVAAARKWLAEERASKQGRPPEEQPTVNSIVAAHQGISREDARRVFNDQHEAERLVALDRAAPREQSKAEDDPLLADDHAAASGKTDGRTKPDGAGAQSKPARKGNPLQRARELYAKASAKAEVNDQLSRKFDAIDNTANLDGRHANNSVRLDFDRGRDKEAQHRAELELNAAGPIFEAGGRRAQLVADIAKVKSGPDKKLIRKYLPHYERALAKFDEVAPKIEGARRRVLEQDAAMERAGLPPSAIKRSDHIYEDPNNPEGSSIGGHGLATAGRFKTAADALAAGVDPGSTNLAEQIGRYVYRTQRAINEKAYRDSLVDLKASDGKPALAEIKESQTKEGEAPTAKVPEGYKAVQAGPNVLVVHKELAPLLEAQYGESALHNSRLLDFAGAIKHGALGIDSFHGAQTVMRGLLGFGIRGWKDGLVALDYADRDLDRAVRAGRITQAQADATRASRQVDDLLDSEGLNVGRASDNLLEATHAANLLEHVPLWGKAAKATAKFTFDTVQPAYIRQAARIAYQRIRSRNPKLSEREAAKQASRQTNEFFGNIGTQGFLKSKTLRDWAKVIFFAPSFTSGRFRTEVRGFAQAAKSVADGVRGKGWRVGVVSQAMGQMILASLVGTQIVNLMSRGKPTWENEEAGHKLDAWIPGGEHGFFFSPLSMAAEFSHALMKYIEGGESGLDALAHIGSNKLSGTARAAKDLVTGRDYKGQPFATTGERVKAAVLDAAPLPMQSAALFKKDPKATLGIGLNPHPAGDLEKTLLNSAGFRVDNAPSARSQMYRAAEPFREHKGTSGPSAYTNLRRLLDQNELPAAADELQRLIKEDGKKMADVRKAMSIREDGGVRQELYTGSRKGDARMLHGFSPEQKQLYAKAQREHMLIANRFKAVAARGLAGVAATSTGN